VNRPFPQINNNGTPGQDLLDQQLEIIEACEALIKALRRATPNGRDYIQSGSKALIEAAGMHLSSITAVDDVMKQAREIALAIHQQMKR
jgi:hypothetical protein